MELLPIAFDFETYSEVNLPACGVYVYAKHPSTKILSMAWSEIAEDGSVVEVKHSSNQEEIVAVLTAWKNTSRRLLAWNSGFEYVICKYTADVDLEGQISDPSKIAALAALPFNLGNCGITLKVNSDSTKDKRGKQLIAMLCMPSKTYAGKIKEQDYLDLYDYNKQDIVALAANRAALPHVSLNISEVLLIKEIDHRINNTGIPIDIETVKKAIKIYKQAVQKNTEYVISITGGRVVDVMKDKAFKQFLAEEGFPTDTLNKEAISEDKIPETATDLARAVLAVRRQHSKSSIKKYEALLRGVDDDNRCRGTLKYAGCSTGRWSASQFQPQNLPRVHKDFDLSWVDAIKTGDLAFVETFYECPFTLLSSSIRSMLMAPEGRMLSFCDFNSIEARVRCWLAGQNDILDLFERGECLYKHTASSIYGIPVDQITPEQRTIGKVVDLAFGYQGGAGALTVAANMFRIHIAEEEKEPLKNKWRSANPNIVRLWWAVQNAVENLLSEKDTSGHFVYTESINTFLKASYFRCPNSGNTYLTIRLPSGRKLYYFNPRLVDNNIVYEGYDSKSNRRLWTDIKTYGGKFVENICQAVARDLMVEAMVYLHKNHRDTIDIIFTLHDEIICEHDMSFAALPIIQQAMSTTPHWAPGLPLKASGVTNRRFIKHD